MQSFKDIMGENIAFESFKELALDEQRDVVTNKITAYLVEYNDSIYSVDKDTYDALASHGVSRK